MGSVSCAGLSEQGLGELGPGIAAGRLGRGPPFSAVRPVLSGLGRGWPGAGVLPVSTAGSRRTVHAWARPPDGSQVLWALVASLPDSRPARVCCICARGTGRPLVAPSSPPPRAGPLSMGMWGGWPLG